MIYKLSILLLAITSVQLAQIQPPPAPKVSPERGTRLLQFQIQQELVAGQHRMLLKFPVEDFSEEKLSQVSCSPSCTVKDTGLKFPISKFDSPTLQISIHNLQLPETSRNLQVTFEVYDKEGSLSTSWKEPLNRGKHDRSFQGRLLQQAYCTLTVNLQSPSQWFYNSAQYFQIVVSGLPSESEDGTPLIILFPANYTINSSSTCTTDNDSYPCTLQNNPPGMSITTQSTFPNTLQIYVSLVIAPYYGQSGGYFTTDGQVCTSNNVPFIPTCTFPCMACQSSDEPASCTQCYSNYGYNYLYYQSCVPSCPEETYLIPDVCYDCWPGCASCVSSSNCSICNTRYYFYQSYCYTDCPDGTYAPTNSYYCSSCASQCSSCTSLTVCTDCNPGYALYQSFCQPSCPLELDGPSINCNTCIPGYYLYEGYCFISTPIVPFPFTIISVCILILCTISYITNRKTIPYVMAFSLNSLVEIAVAFILIAIVVEGFQFRFTLFIIIVISVGINGVFLSPVAVCLAISKDPYYSQWESSHKCVSFLSYCLGGWNVKFFFFQFSRAFGAQSLSAPLRDSFKFIRTKYFLMLTLLLSLCVIIACALVIKDYVYVKNARNIRFVVVVDCIIVYSIGMVTTTMYLILNPARMFQNADTESLYTDRSNPLTANQPVQLRETIRPGSKSVQHECEPGVIEEQSKKPMVLNRIR